MTTDSTIVEEVRRRSLEISKHFNDDLRAYARHLREIEDQHRTRVVNQVTVVRSTTS